MELRSELHQVRKGSLSVEQYFTKVKSIADHLADIGDHIPKSEVVMYILRGLGTDYRSLVTFMNSRTHEHSFFELQGFLLTEEQSILTYSRFEEEQLLQANLAFFAQGSNNLNARHAGSGSKPWNI